MSSGGGPGRPTSVTEELAVWLAERVVVSRVLEDVFEPGGDMDEGPPRFIWVMEGVVKDLGRVFEPRVPNIDSWLSPEEGRVAR